MKINKKNVRIIGILILFSFLYIFFAAKPARNSLQFIPQWTIDIEKDSVTQSSSSLYPFKLGKNMGYYSADGKIASMQLIEDRGSISRYFSTTFSSNAQQIDFFTTSGEKAGTIQNAGFPFIDDNRIFLFYPSGNAFSQYSNDGVEQWSYENYVPITAFYSNETGVVVGYADGEIIVFNEKGNIEQKFSPGGSEYEIIFGSAMSMSGRYVASLSGLDRQRIVVFDIEGNTSKIIFHGYIDDASVDQRLVYFSNDEKYVFVNAKDALHVVHISEKKEKKLPIEGNVITIKEVYDGKYFFVLSKYRGVSTVSVYNDTLYKVGAFSFDGENSFLDSDNEFVYIGSETTISKILINED